MLLRLRLMQRLGLLGPIVRAHHRVERWADAPPHRESLAMHPTPREQA